MNYTSITVISIHNKSLQDPVGLSEVSLLQSMSKVGLTPGLGLVLGLLHMSPYSPQANAFLLTWTNSLMEQRNNPSDSSEGIQQVTWQKTGTCLNNDSGLP